MSNLVDQIIGSLFQGNAVTIQGASGAGKSETMRLLKCLLEQDGKRAVYMDMRHVKGPQEFFSEIAEQLKLDRHDASDVLQEFDQGNIALLLDEYWAGAVTADRAVQYAHQKANYVVTIAGQPKGVRLEEYIMR